MRVIFAGTPATALPSLQLLIDSPHEVVAVVTRPDARRGRGRAMGRSAVAAAADEAGIPVLQPQRPSEPAFLDELLRWEPDCVPVVAYGALIPDSLLGLPRHGWVNLHFSLLPAWRGAAPVQHAILAGDSVTGATTFRLDAGMDTGPVYGVVTERIRERDTSGQLLERLSHSGAQLLLATIDGLALERIEARAQPDEDVSYAPKLTPDDLRIDWRSPALRIDRLARAAAPSPGAWTQLRGERVKVGPVTPVAGNDAAGEQLAAGELRVVDGGVVVGTATSPVRLDQVQAAGKRAMAAVDWARGLRLAPGECFE